MNICGCLVHVARDRVTTARTAMEDHQGVEIHGSDGEGRFVVVVEDTRERLASEIIMDLHQIPGVVSLTLTYHHFEDPHPFAQRQPHAGGQAHDHL
ncbi:MAG: chaperone NapD [Pseudomonadota bacterium]